MIRDISITGASGFVGRHLLHSLCSRPEFHVRALAYRTPDAALTHGERVRWIRRDLADPGVSAELLVRDGTLIHLAYPGQWELQAHLANIAQLARAAAAQGVRRVIHCSTAVVVGDTPETRISETTPTHSRTEYERTKLALEAAWREHAAGRFDLAIARPTAVFGPDGRNLLKLSDSLYEGRTIFNYLRSSLFGNRRMNLVCIQNVVSAFVFLAERDQPWDGAAFLISDDDDPLNNFRDVERILLREFGSANYPLPLLPVPSSALKALLRLAGRSNTNPERVYDCSRLRDAGWRKTCDLEQGLREFAAWYLSGRRSSP